MKIDEAQPGKTEVGEAGKPGEAEFGETPGEAGSPARQESPARHVPRRKGPYWLLSHTLTLTHGRRPARRKDGSPEPL